MADVQRCGKDEDEFSLAAGLQTRVAPPTATKESKGWTEKQSLKEKSRKRKVRKPLRFLRTPLGDPEGDEDGIQAPGGERSPSSLRGPSKLGKRYEKTEPTLPAVGLGRSRSRKVV